MLRVIAYQDFSRNYAIAIRFIKEENGKKYIAQPVTLEFKEFDDGMFTDPTIVIPYAATKELLEALSSAGVKADETSKGEGLLIATQAHLEDMRALVFKKRIR